MTVAVFLHIFLAIILVIAAVPKLIHPNSFRQTLRALGIPETLTSGIVRILPISEIIVAGLLLMGSYQVAGEAGLLILLTAFLWSAWKARGKQITCNCFGN